MDGYSRNRGRQHHAHMQNSNNTVLQHCAKNRLPFSSFFAALNFCSSSVCSGFDPVCGSDGLTHGGLCEVRAKSCLTKKKVRIAGQGPCHLLADVTESCPVPPAEKEDEEAVCGTDGVTYVSECVLRLQKQKSGAFDQEEEFGGVGVLHRGACHR